MTRDTVVIYTDGACDPNPGPGGWAAILRYGRHEKIISGGERETTNNRMEIQAALSALQSLTRQCKVILNTDSEYLRRGITEWLPLWKRRRWRTNARRAVQNQDLWKALADAMQGHEVEWHWVRGHAGNALNERVDRLARAAIPRQTTSSDGPNGFGSRAEDTIRLFTRASCLGSPGPGGWAFVARRGDRISSRSGRVVEATANELEIQAAIQSLALLTQPSRVQILTVSKYLYQGITRWVAGWQARGWRTKEGRPVRHKTLWMELQEAMSRHQVEWHQLLAENRPPESDQAAVLAAQAARAAQEETALEAQEKKQATG